MAAPNLGRVQLKIMQILWSRGRATAREITETLNESEPIAHSTVQTLLRTLKDKGSIDHEVEGRTFVFIPTAQEDKYKRNAAGDLLHRVFGGDMPSLVAHLLKNEKVSRKELDEIRQLIDERGNKR
jgi:BlaI family transcriptional regulator, penicillinase repressor